MSRVRKKKIGGASSNPSTKKQKTIDLGRHDEDILSEDEDDGYLKKSIASDDEDIEEEETLDAKKVRLARQYLQKLQAQGSDDSSSDDSDSEEDDDDENDEDFDRIGFKLQRERLKREGTLEREVATKVRSGIEQIQESLQHDDEQAVSANDWIEAGHMKLLRGHDLTPTCVALQEDGARAISGSKDHSVLIWDVEQQRRSVSLCPTWKQQQDPELSRTDGEVLSVACSDDGRFAAVGRRDATVSIFDIRAGKNSLVKTFTGHKGAITSLSFRTKSLQLFSGSEDRCIRHYNLNEMMYLETLYGHQHGVTGLDCHRKERPISVGRDRTARAWKLAEDSHLIFRGGGKVSSADCVSLIKDDWYLTGHEDGHVGLWMTEKKKAVVNFEQAHGVMGGVGRSISSIDCLKGSDLAMTGSNDGYLRLWKVMTGSTLDSRGLEPLSEIPLNGFVNGLAIGPKARFCVVAVGQEPRLGRWERQAKSKNRFGIVTMRSTQDNTDSEEDSDEDTEPVPAGSDSEDSDSS